jgi:hypothetical protein
LFRTDVIFRNWISLVPLAEEEEEEEEEEEGENDLPRKF